MSSVSGLLWVVPSERHVERAGRTSKAGGDVRVETRERLQRRMFDELVRDRSLAAPLEARLALAEVLPAIAAADPLLAALARGQREGGEAWERTLDALDGSLGALRRASVPLDALARVGREASGGTASRARMLLSVRRAVDGVLEARGLVDPRGLGALLAERIPRHPPARVAAVVGAKAVIARFVLDWDGSDAAWWRALDGALVRAGGEGTRVEVPSFDEGLDAARERGPLDVVSEDVARALDAPPRGVAIDSPLGDLRLTGSASERTRGMVTCSVATDAEGQARAVLDAVRRALLRGAGLEEVAITAGELDDASVAALRRAFDEERIPLYDARGENPAEAGIVRFGLNALALAEAGLRRLDVAALMRSGYVDPERFGVDLRALEDLAYALERTPTAAAPDSRAALEATARASAVVAHRGRRTPEEQAIVGESRAALAGRLADASLPAARAMNRLEHVAAARALFAALGIDPLRGAGRTLEDGSLASDAPLTDAHRVELHAVARDAQAWDLLLAALGDYEAAVARVALERAVVGPRTFRHELALTIDARAGRPEAARAGAIRIVELDELATERLALLVVIDANDGKLPARGGTDGETLHEGLASALRTIDPVQAPASSSTRAARQLAALALAVSAARSVAMVRRSRDQDGGLLAASPVVAWLERGGIKSPVWRASPLDGPPVGAHEPPPRRVARGDARGAGVGAANRRARIERAREGRFEVLSPPADPILGDLDEASGLAPEVVEALRAETGGADRPLAVTNLERFAVCPFQGFAAQVLHARRERPLRELPDRRESGTLIHRALAASFTATAPLWSERPRRAPLIRAQAAEAVELLLQGESVASPLRRLALGRVRDAARAVVAWSLADESWDFALAEKSFGEGAGRSGSAARLGAWPPLVLDDGGVTLALRGSIDRVDLGRTGTGVRAIDYKTSPRAAESGMRALGETAFQVALYARAASNALGREERAGLYVGATRPDDVGAKVRREFEARWSLLNAEDAGDPSATNAVTRIEGKALDVVRRVRQGGLAPRPREESACTTCDASGGCRKPRFAIARDEDDGSAGTA